MVVGKHLTPHGVGGSPTIAAALDGPGTWNPGTARQEVLLDYPLEQSGEEAPNPGFQCLDFGLDFVEFVFLSVPLCPDGNS